MAVTTVQWRYVIGNPSIIISMRKSVTVVDIGGIINSAIAIFQEISQIFEDITPAKTIRIWTQISINIRENRRLPEHVWNRCLKPFSQEQVCIVKKRWFEFNTCATKCVRDFILIYQIKIWNPSVLWVGLWNLSREWNSIVFGVTLMTRYYLQVQYRIIILNDRWVMSKQ